MAGHRPNPGAAPHPDRRPSRGSLAERAGVDSDDRRWLIDDIVNRIATLNLTTVRVVFADAHGVLRGKAIRADQVAGALSDGVGITSALLMKDTGQNNVYPVWAPGGGLDQPWLTGAGDMVMLPDPTTFRVLPWANGTGWMLSDLVVPDGTPIGYSTRAMCSAASDALAADGFGLRVGLEIEFHLFHRRTGHGENGAAPADGRPEVGPPSVEDLTPIHPGWMYLGENRFDSIEPILEVFRSDLDGLGVAPRSMEIELGPGQVEMTFPPGPAVDIADQAVLIRAAVKQIANRHGLVATFMSRPHVPGSFPSGWHLHQSLVNLDDGTNLMAGADPGPVLSPPGGHHLGGLLEHAAESCLLTTPTVTGYKRYRAESLAPLRATWGTQNRGAMLRVITQPASATRIENRIGDPAANPYLYVTAQMVSGRRGLQEGSAPPPETDSPYDDDAGPLLPSNLGAAIEVFERSDLYRSALGADVVDYLVGLKRAEWNRFLATVTDWEHSEYADLF